MTLCDAFLEAKCSWIEFRKCEDIFEGLDSMISYIICRHVEYVFLSQWENYHKGMQLKC